jgi:hypothetical protein
MLLKIMCSVSAMNIKPECKVMTRATFERHGKIRNAYVIVVKFEDTRPLKTSRRLSIIDHRRTDTSFVSKKP